MLYTCNCLELSVLGIEVGDEGLVWFGIYIS